MTSTLKGRTLFITGASRGIGRAIALRAARDGANIAVVAKTAEPHRKLSGTVFSVCEEILEAGGQAVACVADIRSEDQVQAAVSLTLKAFGGIDILVNNASAISLTATEQTDMKRFDLMQSVNARGTFLCSKLCIPHLQSSAHAHILTLSPPLTLVPDWFGPHLAYSLSKYGMSLCTLGLSHELRSRNIAVNSLWPRTLVATAAVENLLGGQTALRHARKPSIVADAAHYILTRSPGEMTGQFLIDEDVLKLAGMVDLDSYAVEPGCELQLDLFVK